ncbi:MAG: hypothetical protein ISR65_09855 [Bacteriovoracaceae bacterium]|nr:hypothetical protein [Bacteriovoracaceae bacterium]
MYGFEYALLMIVGVVIGTYLKASPRFNSYLSMRGQNPFAPILDKGSTTHQILTDPVVNEHFTIKCFKQNVNGNFTIKVHSVDLRLKDKNQTTLRFNELRRVESDEGDSIVVDNPDENYELTIS